MNDNIKSTDIDYDEIINKTEQAEENNSDGAFIYDLPPNTPADDEIAELKEHMADVVVSISTLEEKIDLLIEEVKQIHALCEKK